MDRKEYRNRELVGVIVVSFLFPLVSLILDVLGVQRALGTMWTIVLASVISGVSGFMLSYYIITSGFRKWVSDHWDGLLMFLVVATIVLIAVVKGG